MTKKQLALIVLLFTPGTIWYIVNGYYVNLFTKAVFDFVAFFFTVCAILTALTIAISVAGNE